MQQLQRRLGLHDKRSIHLKLIVVSQQHLSICQRSVRATSSEILVFVLCVFRMQPQHAHCNRFDFDATKTLYLMKRQVGKEIQTHLMNQQHLHQHHTSCVDLMQIFIFSSCCSSSSVLSPHSCFFFQTPRYKAQVLRALSIFCSVLYDSLHHTEYALKCLKLRRYLQQNVSSE